MTTPCAGAAALRARWTARALAGAALDLALTWACLCLAALAAAAAALLARLPCTCARPHLPCLLAFLARYPPRAVAAVQTSIRSRFPFAAASDDEEEAEPEAEPEPEPGDPRRRDEARADLQRELERERSAAASAAEEAMAMILRLQKDKSALEIEARQHRRTADERCAFYEGELEELRDILLLREREARALRKELDAYRRLLGLAASEDGDVDDDEQEMVTPHSVLVSEGDPSSSRSLRRTLPLGNDPGFGFRTPFLRDEFALPVQSDNAKGADYESIAVQTQANVPLPQSSLEVDSSGDDGTETVEILPLSTQSQRPDFHVDAGPGMETMQGQTSDEFQEVICGGIDKIGHDATGTENDANVYDVHVIDDICFTAEVKGLIGRSFSDATMQAEKLQTRVAADDLLGKSLTAIKGAQDRIRLAASERRQSLQLQLLEDIANQLQEIKDAAEAGRQLYCASPKTSKKS